MLKALERSAASASQRIVFLAPSASAAAAAFPDVQVDPLKHDDLLRQVQRFRGAIYLKDGAIHEEDLTADGRHETWEDDRSWHMVLIDDHNEVNACALYLEHAPDVPFDELRVRHCPLADDPEWRPTFVRALRDELARARAEGLRYVELGGWAVSEKSRTTSGALSLALAVYGFSRRGAGALGMTTATVRHCSAKILKRLGGSRFEADGTVLPPYFDPRYNCFMELLRFDSRKPNPQYLSLIDGIGSALDSVRVLARPDATLAAPMPAMAGFSLDGLAAAV
ncbi:MAG: hypothetical protein JSU08_16190 [Acidobacteria bacterium]|nr:hypothetical protein [Acidobacteriota bacterium]